MNSNIDLSSMFFTELKRYNLTNFRTIAKAELVADDATVHKAFSSVVTRFFIFREKHPELSQVDGNILYFKLKIDMIARYFSEYPASNIEELRPFQLELLHYMKTTKHEKGVDSDESTAASIQDKFMEPAAGM